MLTAETIADEQIRKLRADIIEEVERAGEAGLRIDAREHLADCSDALNPDLAERHEARARCAAILNARAKETPISGRLEVAIDTALAGDTHETL